MSDPRSAVVTGGGRGIGRAIAQGLGREGWGVGVLARTEVEVKATATAIREAGGRALALTCDVLDPRGLEAAVSHVEDEFGGLDALICAAGRFRGIGPVAEVDPSAWWGDIETSLRGVMLSTRAALPLLRKSDLASITLLVGPGHNGEVAHGSGYGAAQAGLVRLAESLGQELKGDRIAVYALNPGLVPTALTDHLTASPEGRRWLPRFTEGFAEGKEVGPEVAAEMAAWLCRDRPMELTGRVVGALATPEIVRMRLARIVEEDSGRLRLR